MLESPNRAHLPPSPYRRQLLPHEFDWTDETVAKLTRLWESGFSSGQIATELGGVTRNAVCGKIDRLGLTGHQPRKPKPARYARTADRPRADKDRSATMRIKTLKVRGPANGGAQIVECVVREEAPQPAEFLGITFANLEPGQCKFPRGEGRDITFCGQPRMSGEPYCRNCCRVAFTYTPPPVKRPYLPTGGSKPRVF